MVGQEFFTWRGEWIDAAPEANVNKEIVVITVKISIKSFNFFDDC